MYIKSIGFLVLLTCVVTATKAQDADKIVAKYIAFTGGEEQWKKVKTIVASGTYNYGGIEFPFTTYSKAPNLYKFIVPFKGKYFAQAFDGSQGWKIDAFKGETKKTVLTGKPALAMANEADVELQSPLIDYRQKGHTLSYEGKDTVEGKLCYEVKLVRKSGDVERWYFDGENYELVKKQAVSKNAELENSVLDTYFSDYRLINNVRIPFKLVSKANDQTVLTITTSKVEVNTAIPATTFRQ